MNKQSNVYTTIYIIILVVLVGTALALTSLSLKDRQQANSDNDKRKQILASINVTADSPEAVIAEFDKYITGQLVVNEKGDSVGDNAFGVNIAAQIKESPADRLLPLYICDIDNSRKYIIPLYGAGLWGPIWGYISLNDDCSTVYGAFFDHQGETPGLGAEITKDDFRNQFSGKNIFKGDNFLPIAVVKAGQAPNGQEDYVNGISGGTITSKGVGAMLDNCLSPYRNYLDNIRKK